MNNVIKHTCAEGICERLIIMNNFSLFSTWVTSYTSLSRILPASSAQDRACDSIATCLGGGHNSVVEHVLCMFGIFILMKVAGDIKDFFILLESH